jgi:hypothetical protein
MRRSPVSPGSARAHGLTENRTLFRELFAVKEPGFTPSEAPSRRASCRSYLPTSVYVGRRTSDDRLRRFWRCCPRAPISRISDSNAHNPFQVDPEYSLHGTALPSSRPRRMCSRRRFTLKEGGGPNKLFKSFAFDGARSDRRGSPAGTPVGGNNPRTSQRSNLPRSNGLMRTRNPFRCQ